MVESGKNLVSSGLRCAREAYSGTRQACRAGIAAPAQAGRGAGERAHRGGLLPANSAFSPISGFALGVPCHRRTVNSHISIRNPCRSMSHGRHISRNSHHRRLAISMKLRTRERGVCIVIGLATAVMNPLACRPALLCSRITASRSSSESRSRWLCSSWCPELRQNSDSSGCARVSGRP